MFFKHQLLADYKQNEVIIKLNDKNSKVLLNSNSALSKYLKEYLGDFQVSPLINTKLIKWSKTKDNYLSITDKYLLQNIFKVKFNRTLDLNVLAQKISQFSEVIYAEPIYYRHINYIPNDTLIHEQYYLVNTQTYEAWKYLEDNDLLDSYLNTDIIIGVVDTGIDFNHIELSNSIAINQKETGIDENGEDKRFNNIDDDNNGFVDDWRGWDFVSDSSEARYDNNPTYGNPHGTHVAGIIASEHNNTAGIAGIGLNMKILPVKIGSDNWFSTSVSNSFDGLLYAGIMGCQIINCSWGGSSFSYAEQDIVNAVTDMGSLIIAAAGNNGRLSPQYPAAYENVISVAATGFTDSKASFSNYHFSVDVAAPGFQIISTIPENDYATWNGTSMASPVAAAVAGLLAKRFPDVSTEILGEMLKSTSNRNQRNDDFYPGMMGSGIVSAYKALSDSTFYSLKVFDVQIENTKGINLFVYGDTIQIDLSIINLLDIQTNIQIEAFEQNVNYMTVIDNYEIIESLSKNEAKYIKGAFKFIIKDSQNYDQNISISLKFTSDQGLIKYYSIPMLINPTFKDFTYNNIKASFNSRGNIAYNDFSENSQGIGVNYKHFKSLLFEGAVLAAIPNKINDVARGNAGSSQKRSFEIFDIISSNNKNNDLYGNLSFGNSNDSNSIGLTINNKIKQSNQANLENIIFLTYELVNTSGEFLDSLFFGLFMDWDIGISGQSNYAYFNQKYTSGIIKNTANDSLPICAISALNWKDRINFYAIDNPGTDTNSFSIYDGFSDFEKWTAISSKIGRQESSITDASYIIGVGPFSFLPQDTILIDFAMLISEDEEGLENSLENAVNYFENNKANEENNLINRIINIFPNPAKDEITIDLEISELPEVPIFEIVIYDNLGKKIKAMNNIQVDFRGNIRIKLSIASFSQGSYYICLENLNKAIDCHILNILK